MAKPFAGPPGIPAERLRALRDAFKATVEDPAFQSDAKQAKLAITPTFGEDTARMVNQVLDLPPEQARRLAEIRR
jgi:tripartite-type tricarboxylate transporter receptor subunit TctC